MPYTSTVIWAKKMIAINKNSKMVLVIGSIVFGGVLFVLGWWGHGAYVDHEESKSSNVTQVRENSPLYKYTNPLLYTDNSDLEFEELDGLKERVQDYLDESISAGNITKASFYYRDLNSGAWTGVRSQDEFVPASMLKVALLMAYLRAAEDDPSIVDKKLYYEKNPNERQNYPPQNKLENGYYPVSQLLGQTIVESDNAASTALALPLENEINKLYKVLRLPEVPEKKVDFLSPRDVSKIFRSLYNSTYLLNSYSEQALDLLTNTNFDKGLTRGVEEGVKVAHKFGEHTVYYTNKNDPDYQLHDCGIVYYPGSPYFVCVMTKGKTLENMENVIAETSRITYDFVKNM